MFIRYFAPTDLNASNELGKAGLDWTNFMLALDVPIRLVSARVANIQSDRRGRSENPWGQFRDLLLTPMDGGFVNVVCTEPEFWGRLWTAKRQNVLLCPFTAPVEDRRYIEAALKYDVLIVPTEPDAELWRAMGGSPHVMDMAPDRLEHFRTLLGLV